MKSEEERRRMVCRQLREADHAYGAEEIERLAEELEKTRKDRDEWHFKLQHFLVRYAKENQP